MWKCKLCGGEIKKVVKVEQYYDFTVREYDDETTCDLSFDEENVRDSCDSEVYFECDECSNYTNHFEYVKEISDWIKKED